MTLDGGHEDHSLELDDELVELVAQLGAPIAEHTTRCCRVLVDATAALLIVHKRAALVAVADELGERGVEARSTRRYLALGQLDAECASGCRRVATATKARQVVQAGSEDTTSVCIASTTTTIAARHAEQDNVQLIVDVDDGLDERRAAVGQQQHVGLLLLLLMMMMMMRPLGRRRSR